MILLLPKLLLCCPTFPLLPEADPAAERCSNTPSTQSSEWPFPACPSELSHSLFWRGTCPGHSSRGVELSDQTTNTLPCVHCDFHTAARKQRQRQHSPECSFLICWDLSKKMAKMAICLNSSDAMAKLSLYFFKC